MGKSLGLRAEKPPAAEGNLAHLADVLDFKSKNAHLVVLRWTPYARNDDENDVCNGKVNRLNVEVLLPLNE
ncbi:unnamed protein product [Peronospora farinosa]|uniref:Uncharacterized protein n=1 Tax=Peronospora farinosa TaxID=134698 RepID=A0ABN8BVY9_9STRA|nr:unnamed protein product [Peronospora farinosa]